MRPALLRHRAALPGLAGLAIVVALSGAALLAPLLAPHPFEEPVGAVWGPPAPGAPFGHDNLGRDMLSRLLYGGRVTICVAVLSTLLAVLAGIPLGLFCSIREGWADALICRAVDVEMSIPPLVFTMVAVTIFGPSIPVLIVSLAVPAATRVFRLSRALGQEIVVLDYFEAARMRRESLAWLMGGEILPNVAGPLATDFGQRLCGNVLLIASLSFLGLGVQPPLTDWGSMVRENAAVIAFGGVAPLFPAGAVVLFTIGVSLVVDWGLAVQARQEG